MAIVISDHMDPDVDFYVPPGTDATSAVQQALEIGKIYGVAHIVIRGRIYVFATTNTAFVLTQSENYLFEGDGLGEIVYIQQNSSISANVMIALNITATQEMQQNISPNQSVVANYFIPYTTGAWMVAFKNLRLQNLTNQRWMIAWGFAGIHSIYTYFDSCIFDNASIWINETTEAVVYNCYAGGSELLFDSQSRDVVVIGCRFETNALFAVSSRGWSVIGSVFVSSGSQVNPGNDGNDGNIIGCVFDSGQIVTQGATNLKVVACTLHNVTFPGGYFGQMTYNYGSNVSIIGCTISSYQINLTYIFGPSTTGGGAITIAFNTFNPSSNLVIGIQDGAMIWSVTIIGNVFNSIETHNSFIFITGSPQQNQPVSNIQLTGQIRVLYVAFNTFMNSNHSSGAAYGIWVGPVNDNNLRFRAIAYINVAITIANAYIVFNYFGENAGLHSNGTGQPVGYFSLQQLNSNVQPIANLNFFFNVNENNPIYVPSSQTYNAQFNVGIANSTA